MFTNLTGGLSALSVGTLVLTDNIKIWHVMFFAFMLGMGNAIDGGTKFRSVTQQRANGLVDIRERASIEGELIGGNGGGRVNVVDEELSPRGLATRSVEGAANKNEFIGPIFRNRDAL